MPVRRATKKRSRRTKTRSATKKKRSAIRRRVKYRKHRNWWKKYRGKKYRRTYKKGKLIKYTTKVPISELWNWMYPNIARILAGASVGVKAKNGQNFFSTDFALACAEFMKSMFAWDDRSVFNQGDQNSHALKNNMYFYAFNPILNRTQCGIYFNHYFNQYNWVKFVGLKVKWKPFAKIKYCGNAYTRSLTDGTPAVTIIGNNNIPPLPTGVSQEGRVLYDMPPKHYFNVVFNKDSFMSIPYMVRCLNANYDTIVGNNTPANLKLTSTIMKRLKMFDSYDQCAFKVKKYSLSSPFKFYVRPYEQVMKYEASAFDAKDSSRANQTASEYIFGLTESLNNAPVRDMHMSIPRPASWRRTNVFCPHWLEAKPVVTGDQPGDCLKTTQYVNCLMNDQLYYNPILFGFNFTADLKERDRLIGLCDIEHTKLEHQFNLPDIDDSVSFSTMLNTNNLGNFYFTVYLRFKGRRMNQVVPSSSSFKDPLDGTDNSPSWYS